MTIPQKGRRRVRVGGIDYAWYVRKQPTYDQAVFLAPMTVAIQAADSRGGCVLLVNLTVSRPDNWIHPHQTALKPAMVRAIIGDALAKGWQPMSKGGPFPYAYPLITDRA